MSTIAVRMAAEAPSVIALAGFSGQLANRNVDMAEMPKHTLRMFPSLGISAAAACVPVRATRFQQRLASRRRCGRYALDLQHVFVESF
jgi:hypothetical protein